MRISGDRILSGSPEAIWGFLFDPDRVGTCIPGCTQMRRLDAEHFTATLDLPIPLLRGPYVAAIKATEQVVPERCRLRLTSKTNVGAVLADGVLTLSKRTRTTHLHFEGDVSLGTLTRSRGLSVTGALLRAPAKLLLDRFFTCMQEAIGGAAH